MGFTLDKRLQNDSILASTQHNIQIRLANDSRYFWLILVPAITHEGTEKAIHEIHDLPASVAANLWTLASHFSKALQAETKADKINIAAIGNVVSQLHLHIVARHHTDPLWPAPIWGQGTAIPLSPQERDKRLASVQSWLKTFSGKI